MKYILAFFLLCASAWGQMHGYTILSKAKCDDAADDSVNIQQAMDALGQNGGGVVMLPEGTCKVGTTLKAVSGVSLIGQSPTVQHVSNTNPDVNVIPSGGTWIDCAGLANCMTGSNLRQVNLQNIGFENWTAQAVVFGGNDIDGISFSKWDNIMFVGSTTVNGSDTAIQVYNFQHLVWSGITVFDVNTCYHFINQSEFISGGNSDFRETYCYTYPKSVTNWNNSKPAYWLEALQPNHGTAQNLDVMTFVRPQANSYNGDNTGILWKLDGIDATNGQVEGIQAISMDMEGNYATGLSCDFCYGSTFSTMTVTQSAGGSANTFSFTANSGYDTVISNTIVSTVADANSGVTNQYYGAFSTMTANMQGVFSVNGTNDLQTGYAVPVCSGKTTFGMCFDGWNGGFNPKINSFGNPMIINNTAGGFGTVYFQSESATKAFVDQTGFNVQGHLNQQATGQFASSCAMSAGTTCSTAAFAAAFNGTPVCFVTPQRSSAIAGACSWNNTTKVATVTAASSNSLTWGVVLIGNPN